MTPEGRKVWKSAAGGSLMAAMLKRGPMTMEAQEALDKLRAKKAPAKSAPPPPKYPASPPKT